MGREVHRIALLGKVEKGSGSSGKLGRFELSCASHPRAAVVWCPSVAPM